MLKSLRNLATCQHGTSAVEYGLVAALVAIAILGTLSTLGGRVTEALSMFHSEPPAQSDQK